MARVVLNSAGMRDLLRSEGVARHLRSRALRVAATARASAPRDPEDDGVHYADNVHVTAHDGDTRVNVRVTADVPYAGEVEARHRVLGRALDAARG